MTSGAAVHAKGLQRSSLSDVVIDGQDGTHLFADGI
jgi:hypothetical protein